MADILNDIFSELGVTENSKLGNAEEQVIKKNNMELSFRERRTEIQQRLRDAAQLRSLAITRLNIAFYVVIVLIVLSILVQFFIKGAGIMVYVQTACAIGLFPISRQIERSVTKQAYLEFVAAFLPDLDPKDALKAIDQLYHSMSRPDNVKESMKKKAV